MAEHQWMPRGTFQILAPTRALGSLHCLCLLVTNPPAQLQQRALTNDDTQQHCSCFTCSPQHKVSTFSSSNPVYSMGKGQTTLSFHTSPVTLSHPLLRTFMTCLAQIAGVVIIFEEDKLVSLFISSPPPLPPPSLHFLHPGWEA